MVTLAKDNPFLAQTYEQLSHSQFESGSALLDRLRVRPTDVVLDIGCGTGRLALHVLEHLAPQGRVWGIDPLDERIRIARTKTRAPHIDFHVGVGEDLGRFADASVDVVYLSSVFHWITAKEQALNEIWRVLKPSGRVGITTGARELAAVTTMRQVTDSVLARPSFRPHVDLEDYASTKFGVTSTQMVELFLRAKFSVRQIEIRPNTRTYRSGEEIVDFLESSTFGNYLAHVPDSLRAQARQEIVHELDARCVAGGIPFTGYTLFAIGAKEP